MNKKIIIVLVILILVVVSFFLIKNKYFPTIPEYEGEARDWRSIEITNVLTGDNYILSEINKPILLESFAVWCPTCRKQQEKIKDLHEEPGYSKEDIVSISLDTDPNEDEDKVIKHANKNNFDWIFAVSSIEMTESLIDEFGLTVVNAPSAPVVLICPGGNARLLKNGVKSVEELKSEIETC